MEFGIIVGSDRKRRRNAAFANHLAIENVVDGGCALGQDRDAIRQRLSGNRHWRCCIGAENDIRGGKPLDIVHERFAVRSSVELESVAVGTGCRCNIPLPVQRIGEFFAVSATVPFEICRMRGKRRCKCNYRGEEETICFPPPPPWIVSVMFFIAFSLLFGLMVFQVLWILYKNRLLKSMA